MQIPDEDSVLNLGSRPVGRGHPCLVVAEIGQVHDGSVGTAHAYIDAVARAGVDAVKFQTHIAAAESTPDEPWRVPFSRQDASRYDYWKRMEFDESTWHDLKSHAEEAGLIFLSSPFSPEAVDLLERVGMPAWKLGAGELMSADIIERISQTGKPVLLSSGMCTWSELDWTVDQLRARKIGFGIYQCTSQYPCELEDVGLNLMDEIRARYHCPVGLSDHTGISHTGIAACTLGADMLEVHVTFSRECFGPDVVASLTLEDLRNLVGGVRAVERMLSSPVDKDELAGRLQSLRTVFRKSAVATRDLPRGHVLSRDDFRFKKPGGGISPERSDQLVGRVLVCEVRYDQQITEEFLGAP